MFLVGFFSQCMRTGITLERYNYTIYSPLNQLANACYFWSKSFTHTYIPQKLIGHFFVFHWGQYLIQANHYYTLIQHKLYHFFHHILYLYKWKLEDQHQNYLQILCLCLVFEGSIYQHPIFHHYDAHNHQ